MSRRQALAVDCPPWSSPYDSQSNLGSPYPPYGYSSFAPSPSSTDYNGFDFIDKHSFSPNGYGDNLNHDVFGSGYSPPEAHHHHSERSSRHSQSSDGHGPSERSGNKTKYFCCLHKSCDHISTRAWDLERHMDAKHLSARELAHRGRLYNCPDTRCGARGEHGFKRKDHLRDHSRRTHRRELSPGLTSFGRKYTAPEEKKKKR